MSSFNFDQAAASIDRDALRRFDDSIIRQAAISSVLPIPMTLPRSEFAKFLVDDRAKWHDIAEFVEIKSE